MNTNAQPKSSVLSATAACWALFFSVGIGMVSNGMQGTLIGLRANLEGFSTETTGYVMSGYFVGFALGSWLVGKMVIRVGHVRVFAALASLASAAPLIHAMFIDPYVWFFSRIITGFAFAGIYVVTENWINDRATNETRGKLLSVYMIVLVGSAAVGPLLLNISHPMSVDLFVLASVLISFALIPILLAASPAPNYEAPEKLSIIALYNLTPLSVMGMVVTGMSNGALVGMGAIYADGIGFSIAEVSIFSSLVFVGSVLFQMPIGILSDKFDRRMVFTVITILAAFVPFMAYFLSLNSTMSLMIVFCLFGGLSFPMYSLCLSMANDRLDPKQMLAAGGTLVFSCGVGAILGSPVASYAMTYMGGDGFLLYFVVIHLAIAVFAFFRMSRRSAIPLEDQEQVAFNPTPATFSPVFTTETFMEISENTEWEEEETSPPPDNAVP